MKLSKIFFVLPLLLFTTLFVANAQTTTPTDPNFSVSVETVAPSGSITTMPSSTNLTQTVSPVVSTSPQVQNLQTSEIKGKVVKTSGNTISVEQDDKNLKDITIPDGAKITRDNKDATVQDIKTDDNVVATVDQNMQVVKIDITSSTVSKLSAFAIPGLIIGIILVGLIIYFINKSKQGHIVTAK